MAGAPGGGGDGEGGDVRVPGEVVHVFVRRGGVGVRGWLHAGRGFFDFAEDCERGWISGLDCLEKRERERGRDGL